MPYLVAELADAREVAGRRDQDAGGADDGLDEDRGDRRRALELDDLLEVLRARARDSCSSVVGPERRAVGVRAEEVHVPVVPYSFGQRRGSPVAVIAVAGVAVVAAVEADSTLWRPVCSRAMRTAFSLASAPPLVKKTLLRSGGRELGDAPGGLAAHVVGVLRRDRAQLGRPAPGSRRRPWGAGGRC